MHKRVLVPLESSTIVDSVVSAILELAGVGRVEVALLRVMIPKGDCVIASMDEEARESMACIGVRLRARGARVSTHVRWGAPASREILETARAIEADFIAMPMCSRGEPGGRPVDLAAEAVLRRATVPVLMVPAPRRKLEARGHLTLRAEAA